MAKKFELTTKKAEAEERILGDELYQQERPMVRDALSALRQATGEDDYYAVLVTVMTRVKARQELASEIAGFRQDLECEIAELAKQSPKPITDLQVAQGKLALRKHQGLVNHALRWIWLTIGDGLAWRALDYDRAGIAILGIGERVARFADENGFKAEMQQIQNISEQGVFALHNDLTTCLRHGDVTAIGPSLDAKAKEIQIYEVKAGGHDDPKQIQRLEAATKLLTEGRVEMPDGQVRNLHRVAVPYRTNLSHLQDLIPKARKYGVAAAKIGACLRAMVIDYRHWQGRQEEMMEAVRAEKERLGWPDGDADFHWFTAARRMRDRTQSVAGLAPLSIFPFAIEELTDLLMGFIEIEVCLESEALERCFRDRGVAVNIAQPPESDQRFLTVGRLVSEEAVLEIDVDPHLREQMLTELMTPECLIALCQALLEIIQRRSDRSGREVDFIMPSDEDQVWESYS